MFNLELPFHPTSSAIARQFVSDCSENLDRGHLLERARLVVSELVGNAIRHGRPPLAVSCEEADGGLRVTVSDGSANKPELRDAAATDEAGRGLFLVESLAESWGTDPGAGGGK